MRTVCKKWRVIIACITALLFALASQPGAMAMDAPQPHTAMPCHHQMPSQPDHNPCKNIAGCLGMLACHGMVALDAVILSPTLIMVTESVRPASSEGAGISHRPHNPPPIA